MLVLAELAQDISRLILVHLRRILVPDVDVVLAEREQYRDVLFLDHMALAEPRILRHAANDLRDIVAEHLPDCIDCPDFLHRAHLSYLLHTLILCESSKINQKDHPPAIAKGWSSPLGFRPFSITEGPGVSPGTLARPHSQPMMPGLSGFRSESYRIFSYFSRLAALFL